MTLLDWMAGQETLADWDNPDAIIPKELAQHFGGDMPEGGWSKNPIAAFERDARVRAGMRYTRASAMLAEKARREAVVQESSTTDHSPDSGKVAKLEALNRELAEELEKFTKAVELFIGDGPEVRSSRAILAKAKEVA